MVLYHLNETDPFLETWPFLCKLSPARVMLLLEKGSSAAFLSRSKSSLSALNNISTATIAFPAEDFVPPLKQTPLCWAFTSTVQTPFCCLDFGLALFTWSPIKPAASTLHHIHALQHRDRHVQLYPSSCQCTYLYIRALPWLFFPNYMLRFSLTSAKGKISLEKVEWGK